MHLSEVLQHQPPDSYPVTDQATFESVGTSSSLHENLVFLFDNMQLQFEGRLGINLFQWCDHPSKPPQDIHAQDNNPRY